MRPDLEQILHKSSSRLTKEASIEDAILIMVGAETPLPVVDTDSKLLGVVTQSAILRCIAPDR